MHDWNVPDAFPRSRATRVEAVGKQVAPIAFISISGSAVLVATDTMPGSSSSDCPHDGMILVAVSYAPAGQVS